jgi:hypothetical protein
MGHRHNGGNATHLYGWCPLHRNVELASIFPHLSNRGSGTNSRSCRSPVDTHNQSWEVPGQETVINVGQPCLTVTRCKVPICSTTYVQPRGATSAQDVNLSDHGPSHTVRGGSSRSRWRGCVSGRVFGTFARGFADLWDVSIETRLDCTLSSSRQDEARCLQLTR